MKQSEDLFAYLDGVWTEGGGAALHFVFRETSRREGPHTSPLLSLTRAVCGGHSDTMAEVELISERD